MAKYRKFWAAAIAAAGIVATSGLLEGKTLLVMNTIIAAAGAAGVYLFKNEDGNGELPGD